MKTRITIARPLARAAVTVLAVVLLLAPSAFAQAPADIQKAVDAAYAKYKGLQASSPPTGRSIPRAT